MATERWRPIGGWPYEVSDHGRVRRSRPARGTRRGRILAPYANHKGYLCVRLSHLPRSRSVFVHRLVLVAFLGVAPGPAFQANHKDGDKAKNRPWNLEWVTPAENGAHASRMGLAPRGERQGGALLTRARVRHIRVRLHAGDQQRDVAAAEGVSPTTIWDIKEGRTWGHVA